MTLPSNRLAIVLGLVLLGVSAGVAVTPAGAADLCVSATSCGGCADDGHAHVHVGSPKCIAVPTEATN